MKRRDPMTYVWAVLLSMAAVTGGIGCVVTGFSFENIAVAELLFSWLLAAVVFAVCFSYKVGLYPLAGIVLLGGYLWHKGPLNLSMELLLCRISRVYNNAYGWGLIRWSGAPLEETTATTALCWVGLLVVICVVWAVVSRRGTLPAVTAAFLPVVSCMVVTDTAPGSVWLYLLLLSVVLLLMTHSARCREAAAGSRLTAFLLLPAALALLLLFVLIPQKDYHGQQGAQKLEDWVVNLFDGLEKPEIPEMPTIDITIPDISSGITPETELLRNAGPKTKSQREVMTVTAAQNGTLYLRGAAYDTYNGTAWSITENREDVSLWPGGTQIESVGEVIVSTAEIHDVLYIPYYSTDTGWYTSISKGSVENPDKRKNYSMFQGKLVDGNTGNVSVPEVFLSLPQQTLDWAEPLAQSILGGMSAGEEAAAAIAAYVRGSAVYDLNTQRMSALDSDFARWFLEESDTGYCVHFATATTVLLRAAGIPARYVTGYMLSGQAGEPVTVREHQAHAWVEYCLPGGVWKVLEPTPPAATSEQTQPSEDPSQETVSDGTEPAETGNVPDPEKPTEGHPSEPGDTKPQETPTDADREKTFLVGLLLAVAAMALIPLQWRLRTYLRQRRLNTGRPNDRALAYWRETERLCRRLNTQPERILLELAQKAKFSQHTLTEEELTQFIRTRRELICQLKRKPFPRQLYYTLILADY